MEFAKQLLKNALQTIKSLSMLQPTKVIRNFVSCVIFLILVYILWLVTVFGVWLYNICWNWEVLVWTEIILWLGTSSTFFSCYLNNIYQSRHMKIKNDNKQV